MPNIKSAKKKERQDKKRFARNEAVRKQMKKIIKEAKKKSGKDESLIKKAFSVIDRAVKRKIIHKNKAARLKSSISRVKKQNEK